MTRKAQPVMIPWDSEGDSRTSVLIKRAPVTGPSAEGSTSLAGLEDFFNEEAKIEVNFLRLPYFLISKAGDRFKPLKLTEITERNGVSCEIRWRVNPDSELGLAGSFERSLMFLIHQIADTTRPTVNAPVAEKLPLGSLYSICSRLGIANNGANFKRIKLGIRRLATAQCVSEGAFFSKATKRYVESGKSFTFLSEWGFAGEIVDSTLIEESYVVLHPLIRQNLDVFYVKTLDLKLMRDLKTETAPLLYPHIAAVFHDFRHSQEYWEVGYNWLAQRLGIKVEGTIREAKKQLKEAHQELVKSCYIHEPVWLGDKIRYYPSLRARAEMARQRNRKVVARTGQQLFIPTLEKLARTQEPAKDPRKEEIAFQAVMRLKRNLPLKLDRLSELDIDPQEVYAYAASLETSPDGTSS